MNVEMFEGLESRKKRVFPIHKNISGEWKYPDKGIFASRTLKRKYPFNEQDTATWNRAPKLDVPIAKVSRRQRPCDGQLAVGARLRKFFPAW